MKVKQYIYHWLFFPLLAILLASGTTGCSNESVMEEEDNNTGHTYLTITTRGINVEDNTDFENYVGKLRVMAFDSQGQIVSGVNFIIDDLSEYTVQREGEDSYITVEKEILGGIMTSGTYSFYFVANETGYNTINENETLSEVLETVKTEDELKSIQVKTDFSQEACKPNATNMLMSVGPLKVLIREGENNEIGNANNRIELIRAFAKAQLLLKVESGVTEPTSPEVSLSVSAPDSFYLLPGKEEEITPITTLFYTTIPGGSQPMNTELTASDYFFISDVVYLPERYLSTNTEENAIKYQITLDNYVYPASIADNTTGTLDYNIKRNYAYTTIGTYAPETTVTLNWQVKPYDNVKVDVPTFE